MGATAAAGSKVRKVDGKKSILHTRLEVAWAATKNSTLPHTFYDFLFVPLYPASHREERHFWPFTMGKYF